MSFIKMCIAFIANIVCVLIEFAFGYAFWNLIKLVLIAPIIQSIIYFIISIASLLFLGCFIVIHMAGLCCVYEYIFNKNEKED